MANFICSCGETVPAVEYAEALKEVWTLEGCCVECKRWLKSPEPESIELTHLQRVRARNKIIMTVVRYALILVGVITLPIWFVPGFIAGCTIRGFEILTSLRERAIFGE